MTQLLIDLPEDLEAKLKSRALRGGYADTQEYLRALIVADADVDEIPAPLHVTFKNKDELEKLLMEGINSGESREITEAEWHERRRKLRERYSKSGLP